MSEVGIFSIRQVYHQWHWVDVPGWEVIDEARGVIHAQCWDEQEAWDIVREADQQWESGSVYLSD